MKQLRNTAMLMIGRRGAIFSAFLSASNLEVLKKNHQSMPHGHQILPKHLNLG
jgi:hypothetical protein